jgi:hypothetical protein
MSKRKSISQRLASAGSLEVKREILRDWVNNWESEQGGLINMLSDAIDADDQQRMIEIHEQLRGLTNKRFPGLRNVLEKLIGG